MVGPVILQLQKTLTTDHALVYGKGAGGVTGITTTAETFISVHTLVHGVGWQVMGIVVLLLLKTFISVHTLVYGVGWQMIGPVVLQLLKILTTVHILMYGMGAGDGTGTSTTVENIDHCPYCVVRSGLAGDGTGSSNTRSENNYYELSKTLPVMLLSFA